MTSAIDATKPVTGNPTTQSVRDNFAAAKSEIEAIQGRVGFIDYNDTATATTPIAVSSSVWTKLTNNGLGANSLKKPPAGVTDFWNAVTNQFSFTELPLFSMIDLRVDVVVTTSGANQTVQFRMNMAIGDAINFQIPSGEFIYKTAGAHSVTVNIPFYIGSNPVKNNPAEIQIFSDAACTVRVNGWYIRASKYIAP